jgi:hypothetical protein
MVVSFHINLEEDEPDMGSDKEEFVLEHGNFMTVYSVWRCICILVHMMAVDYSSISSIEVMACCHLPKKN